MKFSVGVAALIFLAQVSAFATVGPDNNLHQIDADAGNGFAVYRSGEPTKDSFKLWCSLGIREVMVLAGTAATVEEPLHDLCPDLKVVYNVDQNDFIPLDPAFLSSFDRWVGSARAAGTKILFRCNCGCHRTGRLAAYYRIRFEGWNADRAIEEMYALGQDMDKHPYLVQEVRALEDFVRGRACSQPKQFCVPAPSTQR